MLYVSAVTTETKQNIFQRILDSAKGLTEKGVVAGFPKGRLNTPHYENGESIIDVAIKNNYGMGVPRRDFMTPSSKKWMKFFSESLDIVRRDLIENKVKPDNFLNAMGRKAQNIIRDEITALDTPPNAPSTIAKKGSNNPLVDTGDMRKAVTWQIRKAKEK